MRASETLDRSRRVQMTLAAFGIIGPIWFTILVVILGSIRPGYSHLTQAISELGEVGAPNAMIQNINFLVLGLLTLAFAFGLDRGVGGGEGSKSGPALLGVFAVVALMGNAFLPCDPGCDFVTVTGTLHNVTGLTGFLAFIAATLIISRRLMNDPSWQGYTSYSLASGGLAAAFLVIWILSPGALPSLSGMFQTLMVGVVLLWIAVMATRLLRLSVHPAI